MFNNLWFPYFSLKENILPLKVKAALGSKLILENGRELVDGVASWWSVCHGYSNPYIISKMKRQLETLSHVMFAGLVHGPAEELSEKLINFIDAKELSRVFFSDSGSTAVEVAIKMAIQFFHAQGLGGKNKIVYFKDGYHGETLGALSLSESTHSLFPSIASKVCFKIPETLEEFAEFESSIAENKDEIACGIIEPMLQGAGGMIISEPERILKIWQIFRKYNILIIADECATGFYRLGEKFAFKKVGMVPDILVLGKALTAGYIPFAATIAGEFIFREICTEGRFFHGPTFMANPLAASAAIASIEIFEKEDYGQKVAIIESFFRDSFKDYDAKVIGAVCVLGITRERMLEIRRIIAEGKTDAFLRPFGSILYSMPPLNITKDDLEVIASDMKKLAYIEENLLP